MLEIISRNLDDVTYRFAPVSNLIEYKADLYRKELAERYGDKSLVLQALSGSLELIAGYLVTKATSFVVGIPETIIDELVVRPLQVVKFCDNKRRYLPKEVKP